ncbi:hypothetical protein Tsubulata_016748 [Turnera subulata]|uniref:THO1-MOS11 C-terminal domain-containing protein n=1 Tax=Turnera subulata TaxID=218843 RepID=A0A9Q0FHA2_9ROSI|nr:hypothetical protein Tsubulata_016748 [Turnera subulata]
MATQTENPIAAEGNPSKAPTATAPASTNPDQADNPTPAASSTATDPAVDSGTDEPKKGAEESKDKKDTSVSPVSGPTAAVTDTEKKIRRAERFGINVQLSEEEKRNSRAERFGTAAAAASASPSSGSDPTKKAEELKRKARAERFGLPVPSLPADEEAKKKARLERFAPATKTDAVEEDKRKARALRFSQPSTGSLSVNGKANIEQNAAITSNAGGGS